MKNYMKYMFVLFLASFVLVGCDDEYASIESEYGQKTLDVSDPSVNVLTPVVSFVAGNEDYTIDFLVAKGKTAVSKINVYKVFTDSETGASSNEVLLKSFEAGSNGSIRITDKITYEDLKSGLTVNGGGLPAEADVPVGSKWDLRIELESGGSPVNKVSGKIVLGVLSRFAGIYKVIESDYYRIGEKSDAADWTGQKRFIGSVNATRFAHVDGWGPFHPGYGGAVGEFVFDLNDDNSITIVDDNALQLFFSGDEMLTCQEDSDKFVNVPCEGSNVLIPNDETGKHIIKLTYGYFTNGSGAREFYEVLEKIVE